jgi:hypothetical protein
VVGIRVVGIRVVGIRVVGIRAALHSRAAGIQVVGSRVALHSRVAGIRVVGSRVALHSRAVGIPAALHAKAVGSRAGADYRAVDSRVALNIRAGVDTREVLNTRVRLTRSLENHAAVASPNPECRPRRLRPWPPSWPSPWELANGPYSRPKPARERRTAAPPVA